MFSMMIEKREKKEKGGGIDGWNKYNCNAEEEEEGGESGMEKERSLLTRFNWQLFACVENQERRNRYVKERVLLGKYVKRHTPSSLHAIFPVICPFVLNACMYANSSSFFRLKTPFPPETHAKTAKSMLCLPPLRTPR